MTLFCGLAYPAGRYTDGFRSHRLFVKLVRSSTARKLPSTSSTARRRYVLRRKKMALHANPQVEAGKGWEGEDCVEEVSCLTTEFH